MTLFGASPAVCSTFVEDVHMACSRCPVTAHVHMPYGTSLRMGRLGYQSDAQSSLAVSYNNLEELRRIVAGRIDTALSSVWKPSAS